MLLITVAVLIGLSTLGQVSKYCFGHPELKGFVPSFYVDYESNVPTWYSSMALALAGGLLCLIAIVKYRNSDHFRHHWAALSLIFFGLSMDEIAGFHELPIQPMRDAYQMGGLLYYPWVLPAIVLLLVMSGCFAFFLRHLPRKTCFGFLTAAGVFCFGAIGIEMMSGLQADSFSEENLAYAMIVTAEETCEMVGIVIFIHFLMNYIHATIGMQLKIGNSTVSKEMSNEPRIDSPCPSSTWYAKEINSISELQPYRTDWNRLLEKTPGATFFQSLPWLETYWQHYGDDQRLRVVLVFDQEELVGVTPLVVRRETTRVGPVRFLTYPLDYWGSSYGPLGEAPHLVLQVALQHVQHAKRDFDAIELRWIAANDKEPLQTADTLQNLGWQAVKSIHDHTCLVELDCTWEEYLASRKGKWRNNLRRWQRRLEEHGEVRYVRYRCGANGDPRWDLYEQCLEIARESWQGASRDGTTLTHESVASFLRDVHQAAATAGAVDINLLYVDDRPVAFVYGYYCASAVYGLRVGMLPEFSKASAGNLLYAYLIEDSCRRGDRCYDLGCGSLAAKRHLQTSLVPLYRIGHFPLLSLRCQLLRLKRMLEQSNEPSEASEQTVAV